jgi:uncharacterized membrane protein
MTVEQGMKFIVSIGLVSMSDIQAGKLKHAELGENRS